MWTPAKRSPGAREISAASATVGAPGFVPQRPIPPSISTSTSSVTPAAVAASDR